MGIRINARIIAVQPRKPRPVGAGQTHRDPGLQNAVARADPLLIGVVTRPIQRVRHRADQFPRRVTRQLGIGVQGNHILHIQQNRGIADHPREAILSVAAQQRVQIRQLAALALIPHPDLFLRIPAARAMEQEKRFAAHPPILLIQRRDPLCGEFHQRVILWLGFLRRIPPISQQRKVQAVIAIGQKSDFQRLDQRLDALYAGQHRWRYHQGAGFRRNTGGKIHARRWIRRGQQCRQPVHQRHR